MRIPRRYPFYICVSVALVLFAGCATPMLEAAPPDPSTTPSLPTSSPTATLITPRLPSEFVIPTPVPLPVSSPEAQGMDSATLTALFDYIDQTGVDMHSLLVMRHGTVVLEAYFFPYRQSSLHGLASCTKSFSSALIGIAIDEGFIEGVDVPVAELIPDYDWAEDDPRKQTMTLEHLLLMTSGLDWPEASYSYTSPANPLLEMFESEDWVQFTLQRPLVMDPGTAFNYNSGVSHLLTMALEEATGMRADDFAREYLFDPLGAYIVYWTGDPQGHTFGAGGLNLTTQDMARFGQLYLQGGVWEGEQIVPADWVATSTTRQVASTGPASGYGYQWWVRPDRVYGAFGYRGQRIFVVPDLDMVVVFTADLAGSAPSYILNNYVMPAAISTEPLQEHAEAWQALEARIEQVSEP